MYHLFSDQYLVLDRYFHTHLYPHGNLAHFDPDTHSNGDLLHRNLYFDRYLDLDAYFDRYLYTLLDLSAHNYFHLDCHSYANPNRLSIANRNANHGVHLV